MQKHVQFHLLYPLLQLYRKLKFFLQSLSLLSIQEPKYRQAWDLAFREFLKNLEKEKPIILCGDLNVAHSEIDLARPKANTKNPGFTKEEREGFDKLIEANFIDTFREFEKGGGHYSWWSYRAKARERNVGWRIDYWCISESLRNRLQSSTILDQIMGSDHCPVMMHLK